ncbi:SOS response-associated peptidase family protein, partial [Nitrosovibrio sp. Nv6]|uniref:SOS response-associated peptidase family protein n=1 Tax=Nitrosovibrio sp. Nv6 TaxID=1855340 RepID=UPI0021006F3A
MLSVDPANGCEWVGDSIPHYNVAPGLFARTLRVSGGKVHVKSRPWGYRTPQDAAPETHSWINARAEKALSGYYFRHMFREGRLIIPAGGWFEWLRHEVACVMVRRSHPAEPAVPSAVPYEV